MRKILTILAVCCLLFWAGGYHFLFQCRLAEVKTAMKKRLRETERNRMTRLVLTVGEASTLHWEGSSEFRYGGEMYDLLETERVGGKLVLWCLPDKSETALVDEFLKANDPSSQKSTSHSLFKLLKTPCFLPAESRSSEAVFENPDDLFSRYLYLIPAVEKNVLTPPPRSC